MAPFDTLNEYKTLYQPPKGKFVLVDVPRLQFLMIDGHGNPNTHPDYPAALSALYGLAYGIKFALKAEGFNFRVPPLEGLWFMENMAEFMALNKDDWDWTMMILMPFEVTQQVFERAQQEALQKKELSELSKVRLEDYTEGTSAQILYFGAYADEGPTILRLHEFIHSQGFELSGKHHEIYMGDPRRSAPEKLKTIIRQPCRHVG